MPAISLMPALLGARSPVERAALVWWFRIVLPEGGRAYLAGLLVREGAVAVPGVRSYQTRRRAMLRFVGFLDSRS